jgi:hypothetical protein
MNAARLSPSLLRRSARVRLSTRSGTEGSRDDPYGWNERTTYRDGDTFSLRDGALGYTRFYVNGRMVEEEWDVNAIARGPVAAFLDHSGFASLRAWDRAYERAHPPGEYDDADRLFYGHP